MNKLQEEFNWARIKAHMKKEDVIRCVLRQGDTTNRMRRLASLVTDLTALSLEEDRADAAWFVAGRPEE